MSIATPRIANIADLQSQIYRLHRRIDSMSLCIEQLEQVIAELIELTNDLR